MISACDSKSGNRNYQRSPESFLESKTQRLRSGVIFGVARAQARSPRDTVLQAERRVPHASRNLLLRELTHQACDGHRASLPQRPNRPDVASKPRARFQASCSAKTLANEGLE